MNLKPSHCELCMRPVALTFHHLIPRKVHRRARFRKKYNKEQLNQGVWLCRQCHKAVHKFYSETELAQHFYRLDLLKTDPKVIQHVQWVKKQRERAQ